MAADDYNVADRPGTPRTAADRIAETEQGSPDAETRAWATAAGVSQAAYANYATALDIHTDREDIEGLAERRAREYGDTFAAADFMRNLAYEADGDATAAPRPGTVHGLAPDSGVDDAGTETNSAAVPTGYGDGA